MRKALSLILALAMILALASCGGSAGTTGSGASAETSSGGSESASAQDTGTTDGYLKDNITVALSSDGSTMDPFASFATWGNASMTSLIFQGLIQTDYDYNCYYEMAKEITQIDDLHWQVVIWDCIYDTAGNHITIDDVIWCYDQLIDSGNAGAIPKFESIEKTDDDYTAVMTLNEAFGDGDFVKHFGNVKVLSRTTYEEVCDGDMTTNPIGTGPYMLQSYTVGSQVVLEANEDYWGNNVEQDDPFAAQNFKTITYEIIQSASSRAIALEMGSVDIVDSMDAMDIDNLDSDEFNLIELPQRPPVIVLMNASSDSPLQSLELRQAILYALNNQAIADAMSVPATVAYGIQPNLVDSPESWTTGEGRSYYDYDPDKAEELLAASGYSGETLELMYVSSVAFDDAATMIQSELSDLGVNVEQLTVDQTTGIEYQYDSTKWDLMLLTQGGGAYLTQVLKGWWSEDCAQHFENGENIAMVPDTKLDELFVALSNDVNDDTIAAWDEYFNSMAYGYAICSFSNQTACSSELQSTILTSQSAIVPNAFVLAD